MRGLARRANKPRQIKKNASNVEGVEITYQVNLKPKREALWA